MLFAEHLMASVAVSSTIEFVERFHPAERGTPAALVAACAGGDGGASRQYQIRFEGRMKRGVDKQISFVTRKSLEGTVAPSSFAS
jgi:hypothetical protein